MDFKARLPSVSLYGAAANGNQASKSNLLGYINYKVSVKCSAICKNMQDVNQKYRWNRIHKGVQFFADVNSFCFITKCSPGYFDETVLPCVLFLSINFESVF